MAEIIPILPLHTVLFPRGKLPLKIFEIRYLDMVSECLRNQSGFGVCLIRAGVEVGKPAEPVSIGTFACISDWQQNPSGLLGITIEGKRRFKLLSTRIQADNLVQGEIEWIEQEHSVSIPARFRPLQELVAHLSSRSGCLDDAGLNDAVWLGYRLAELMPASLQEKQQLLELTDPLERLDQLLEWFQQPARK